MTEHLAESLVRCDHVPDLAKVEGGLYTRSAGEESWAMLEVKYKNGLPVIAHIATFRKHSISHLQATTPTFSLANRPDNKRQYRRPSYTVVQHV